MIGISYYEAEAFCKWAGGRLPTEAEWEKAARWNAKEKYPYVFPWGGKWDAEKCNNLLDHNRAAGGFMYFQTAPVGSYPSGVSPYGCHDMAGNVDEWCSDGYDVNYYSQSPPAGWLDPKGVTNSTEKVLRGSSWLGDASFCYRCAYRGGLPPMHRSQFGGFRLARDCKK